MAAVVFAEWRVGGHAKCTVSLVGAIVLGIALLRTAGMALLKDLSNVMMDSPSRIMMVAVLVAELRLDGTVGQLPIHQ